MQHTDHFEETEIIDLDRLPGSESRESEPAQGDLPTQDDAPEDKAPERIIERLKHIVAQHYMHIATAVIILGVVIFAVCRFANFGEYVDQSEIFKDGEGKYEDVMDLILPVDDEFLEGRVDDGVTTIVAFGNAPFADDRESPDSLLNIIQDKTDAVIYNCAVEGSYLASQEWVPNEHPMDAYTFYWLACLACGITDTQVFDKAAAALGEDTPPGIDGILDQLTSIDFNEVDVIAVMYDAQDYMMGNYIYDISYHKNLTAFTGNLVAGLEVFQDTYPHIRIIVMSPTYAFAVNEEGEYVSSDQYKYNPKEDVLSTYCILQGDMCSERAVSFVDNIYGTINEDNAREYLKDNIKLNQAGREAVADRFIYALTYFD